jgi:hypothetical protein
MGFDSLIVALRFNQEIMVSKMSKLAVQSDKMDEVIHSHLRRSGGWYATPLSDLERDMLYLKRIDWILKYHCALCQYMMKCFDNAQEVYE